MATSTELDVLECFRDAKVEGKPIPIRDYVPFQESYIETLMNSLEREGLLEWDDQRGGFVITRKGMDYANKARPREEPKEDTEAPKGKFWRYGGG